MFKRLFSEYNRSLLRELVITDFKLRYQGSWLGYLWSILKPLAIFAILYIVFSKFLRFGDAIPHYPTYLLLGIVVWNFFVEASMTGLQSIVTRGDLLRKVNIPKYIIVLSTLFSALINLLINMVVVFVFIFFSSIDITINMLYLPLLFLELLVLTLGVSFFLSALYVRFRDVSHIWELVLQLMFYATPIIYPITLVPENFAQIIIVNPMAQIIQDMRYVLITQETTTLYDLHSGLIVFIPFALIALTIFLATVYFRKQSAYFAENV